MNPLELLRDDLRDFAGYSSARKEAAACGILLNANECPWPQEGDALGLNRYPSPQPAPLLAGLAALYGCADDRLLISRGSDEAIDLLTRACCRAGRDAVLVCPPTFGMYAVSARLQNARLIEVPLLAERGFAVDVDAVIAALRPEVKLVFLCSPNNPSGNTLSAAEFDALAAATRGRALMVVDEAYGEFSRSASALGWAERHAHVAVLRTLSKAYALAGARIGALIADAGLITALRRLMAPYPLPTPSVAAALAALQPAALALARSRVHLLIAERERLAACLGQLDGVVRVWPSEANFLLLQLADVSTAWTRCQRAGIVVRRPQGAGLEHCLRISIGTPAENDALLAALADEALA